MNLSLSLVRALSQDEARKTCQEIREFLVENVSRTGGHLASNLGIVEISMALARQMDLPGEKVIYDTGHQCYVHKILTGRANSFSTLRTLGGISGFPSREESVFDAFGTGHSGTGLSAALGFSRASRLRGEDSWAVVVIGDGAFSGGMVFEALNNLSREDKVIVILNDNGMSISKSVGTLKRALNRMRTAGYYRFKGGVHSALSRLSGIGEDLALAAKKMKDSVKRSALPMDNLFEQFGLHYFGPADGNNLAAVELLLKEAKKRSGPSLIHLCTKKGKGYRAAEQNPSRFHGLSPQGKSSEGGKSFSQLFGEALLESAAKDERIVAITAAMADGVGLAPFAKAYPHRFFDIGIAEEHAMTFAAALSAAGERPVFAVYSTFFQRAFDQFLHDAALQKLPVILALDRAGIVGEDGATHHGLFDLPLTLPVPGVKIYAPCTKKELEKALSSALAEDHCPSVLRYPRERENPIIQEHFPCQDPIERVDFGPTGPRDLGIVTFGRSTKDAILAAEDLASEGMRVSLIRFGMLKGFDPALLPRYFSDLPRLLFVEEGIRTGGFSQYLLDLLRQQDLAEGVKEKILAVEGFLPHGNTGALLRLAGLDHKHIQEEGKRLAET